MMEELKKKLLDLLGEEGFRAEESMAISRRKSIVA